MTEKKDDLISVIIPVYNAEKYLKKCIESIITQSYRNIEIILINDGSTDSSMDICRYYAACDNRVRFIDLQTRGGVSRARNLGIENAQGYYICFVDADDYVSEDYVSFLYRKVVQYDADIATCAFHYETKPGIWKQIISGEELCFNRTDGIISFFKKDGINASPCCKLYKANILSKFHIRFDETIKIAEDKLFCYEYLLHCVKIHFSSQTKYFYALHAESASNKKNIPRRINDSSLGFLAMKEIEKLVLKGEENVIPYYYSFAAKVYVRSTYRWNLFRYLPYGDIQYIRKYVKRCYINGNKQELWNAKKSYFAGMILIMSKTLTVILCSIVRRFHKKKI